MAASVSNQEASFIYQYTKTTYNNNNNNNNGLNKKRQPVAQFVMTSRLLSTYNKATDSLGQLWLPPTAPTGTRSWSDRF